MNKYRLTRYSKYLLLPVLLAFTTSVWAVNVNFDNGYLEIEEDFENPADCWPKTYSGINQPGCAGWNLVKGKLHISNTGYLGGNAVRMGYEGDENAHKLIMRFSEIPSAKVGYSKVYMSFMQYFEAGFVFPASLKTVQIFRENDFSTKMTIEDDYKTGISSSSKNVHYMISADRGRSHGKPLTTGRWYNIEMEFILDTTKGTNPNGIIRTWVDGVLVGQITNAKNAGTKGGLAEWVVFGMNYSNGCCGGWQAKGPIFKYFDNIYVAAGYSGPAPRRTVLDRRAKPAVWE